MKGCPDKCGRESKCIHRRYFGTIPDKDKMVLYYSEGSKQNKKQHKRYTEFLQEKKKKEKNIVGKRAWRVRVHWKIILRKENKIAANNCFTFPRKSKKA